MHWHGIRQYNSPGMDGVNGVSECALAPGQTKTYTFQCTQYGSSWYHSHYSSQYGMGVVGTILIDGPATENYDIDLGTFPMMDWYYRNADVINAVALTNAQAGGGAPPSNTLLLNGTNNNGPGGKYQSVALTKGKKHRLRLINTSVDSHMMVKLDGHPFTVIEADFIPVTAVAADEWLLVAIGQRYDVVFEANQTSGNYWFRAEVANECGSASNGNGRAIFRYDASDTSVPSGIEGTAPTSDCIDFPTVPYWKQSVPKDEFVAQAKTLSTGFGDGVTVNGQNLLLWHLNTTGKHLLDYTSCSMLMSFSHVYPLGQAHTRLRFQWQRCLASGIRRNTDSVRRDLDILGHSASCGIAPNHSYVLNLMRPDQLLY